MIVRLNLGPRPLSQQFGYSKLQVEILLGGNSEVETFQLLFKTGRIDEPEPQFLTLISQLNDMVQNREKL